MLQSYSNYVFFILNLSFGCENSSKFIPSVDG